MVRGDGEPAQPVRDPMPYRLNSRYG
jgi:hypothetical protein